METDLAQPDVGAEPAPVDHEAERMVGALESLGEVGHAGRGVVDVEFDVGLPRVESQNHMDKHENQCNIMSMPVGGRYSLDQLLASSPDATVWRGRCTRPIERPVAVKELKARNPDEAARLLEEVTALVRLDHPHVVRVFEVLDDTDGVTVVMQYAPGGSLAELLASRQSLDAGETVALAAPLADALASAHRQGIVHGDVKPSNVLLSADGEPLLADFGCGARGTDGYIAPEVLDGSVPDGRADIYALGVVCREALGDDVPAELASVLDAAVAIDPDDRPSDASELARLLRAAVPVDEVRLPGPTSLTNRVPGRPTRVFGPRPAAPVVRVRHHHPRVALLLLPLLVGGALWLHPAASTTRDCEAVVVPDGAQVARGDTSRVGCLSVGVYDHQILTIRVHPDDPKPRRFAIGLPGDVLTLIDANCDGMATPSLFRPSTGETLYYDSWSTNERPSSVRRDCR